MVAAAGQAGAELAEYVELAIVLAVFDTDPSGSSEEVLAGTTGPSPLFKNMADDEVLACITGPGPLFKGIAGEEVLAGITGPGPPFNDITDDETLYADGGG